MPYRKEAVLILEDSIPYRDLLAAALQADFEPLAAGNLGRARLRIEQGVAAVLCDVRLGNDESNRDGLKLVEELAKEHPTVPFIVMTGFGDINDAVVAMRAGAADYVQKDSLDMRKLPSIVAASIKQYRLKQSYDAIKSDLRRAQPWDMVGEDPAIQEIENLVNQVATDGVVNVLITGESGTGKELVARAIHARGPRAERPFVAFSISGLPRSTIESELFGHVKGAFTGAETPRIGYFEQAQRGVLFLDEIGELDAELQVTMLRTLETRSFARVGSNVPIDLDVQLVTATNRDMESAVKQGSIRPDFYFRIKTVEIHMPALRERPGDITLLAEYFLGNFRKNGRTRIVGFSVDALNRLISYPFPGNIRELRSIVERAMILAASKGRDVIVPVDLLLSSDTRSSEDSISVSHIGQGIDLDRELARSELAYAQAALISAEGKKNGAWRLLGLNDRFALRRRIKAILDRYPDLMEKFPQLQEYYR